MALGQEYQILTQLQNVWIFWQEIIDLKKEVFIGTFGLIFLILKRGTPPLTDFFRDRCCNLQVLTPLQVHNPAETTNIATSTVGKASKTPVTETFLKGGTPPPWVCHRRDFPQKLAAILLNDR